MSKAERVHLPKYMAEFGCIGSECEASCCSYPWKITVDAETHARISALPEGGLKHEALGAMVPHPESEIEPFQLSMQGGGCALLDECGLCRIHSELGPESLPRTCALYPRQFTRLQRRQEMHGSLSCPEIGRKLLLDPHALEAAGAVSADDLLGRYTARPVAITIEGRGIPARLEILKRVESFVSTILTDRNRPFWQRLFAVGLVMDLFAKKGMQQPDKAVETLIKTFAQAWRTGALNETFASAYRDTAAQLVTLLDLLGRRLGPQAKSPIAPLVSRVVAALEIDYQRPLDALPAYQAAYRQHFEPVLRQHPHVAENYVLAQLRARVVSVRLAAGHKPFLRVVLLYALFRMLGTGIAAERGPDFSVDDLVEVAMLLARTVDQDAMFLNGIMKRFEDLDRLSMPYLGVLFADPPDDAVAQDVHCHA